MSGRKQHYIPQFVLRSFGKSTKGTKTQVRVTSRNKTFIAATDGAAAEREFYSGLDRDVDTLDDVITYAENEYSQLWHSLNLMDHGTDVDGVTVARLITHLGARGNYVRQSLGTFASYALMRIMELFSQEEYFRALCGVDRAYPPDFIKEQLDEFYNRNREMFRKAKMSRHDARRYAFRELKSRWEELFESSKADNAILSSAFDFRQMASEAHQKSLNTTIEPEARVKVLSNIPWKIIQFDGDVLALPDCIALAHDADNGIMPAAFVGNNDIDSAIFPISPNKAVCAGTYLSKPVQETLIPNFSSFSTICSWDFVITPPSYPSDWIDGSRIGNAIINMMAVKMEESIKEEIANTLTGG